MKLWEAWLCLDCEEVFARYTACPACGSRAKVALWKWLNREERTGGPKPAPTSPASNEKTQKGGDAYGDFRTT